MIRYSLKCPEGHVFDSWFKSGPAYDSLHSAGLTSCPSCGSAEIIKALMSPDVKTSRNSDAKEPVATHALAAPASPVETALKDLRKQIQENSEYVGKDFADEARRIHLGEAIERSIYGEASGEDANRLIEDGIPVAPLPFVPSRKSN